MQLFQGNGFTVDDDLAAALSGGLEDSTLALRSSTAITVTAEDLSAGLIELWAGASDGSDLVLAAGSGLHAKRNEIPSSGASNSAEEVASIVLRAGLGSIRALERSEQARVVIAADVTMTDHVTMTDPKGTRLAGLPKKKRDAFALLIETTEALQREGKEAHGSFLKETMKRKQPQFNEEYHGYRSFSRLLEDAAKNELISIRKDARSGTYVVDEILDDPS